MRCSYCGEDKEKDIRYFKDKFSYEVVSMCSDCTTKNALHAGLLERYHVSISEEVYIMLLIKNRL